MPAHEFRAIVSFLEGKLENASQAEIAKRLGLQQPQISAYQNDAPTGERWWRRIIGRIYSLGYRHGKRDVTARLMVALTETFGELPQATLANALGVTQPTIGNWMRGSATPSKTNIEALLNLHVLRLAEPIIEFVPIHPVRRNHVKQSWRFLEDQEEEKNLRDLLRGSKGIYLFYDSAGRVSYLGKTESCLWSEPKQRLKATVNRPFYNPTRKHGVQQADVARYFSAYQIRVPAAIHNLEVLMLRAVPNDAANTNIGKFKDGL